MHGFDLDIFNAIIDGLITADAISLYDWGREAVGRHADFAYCAFGNVTGTLI